MIRAYFDGSCEPKNPGGTMGIGGVVYGNKKQGKLIEISVVIPENPINTNNIAEYLALNYVLDFLIQNDLTDKEISIKGDSLLVVNQMKGKWRLKQGAYLEYAKQAQQKIKLFKQFHINWIPREENEEADRLSKSRV